jgi:outer membrane lipoprotein-sorting protein
MRVSIKFLIGLLMLLAAAGCAAGPGPDGRRLVSSSRQAWGAGWHGVWQVEWAGAPVQGPLVAEVWHAADGRLRVETLEAPVAALNNLVLVRDGTTSWLYDGRERKLQAGPAYEPLSIPLISDALDATSWLLDGIDGTAQVAVAGSEHLESGSATRLKVTLSSGDQAVLWIDMETGLPARLELNSATWGEATFTARSLGRLEQPHPGLFAAPGKDEGRRTNDQGKSSSPVLLGCWVLGIRYWVLDIG